MAAVETGLEGAVLTITLNRPEVLNALNAEAHRGLAEALERAADPSVRAVVITGAGRGFCVGQDLDEFATMDIAEGLRGRYHPNVLAIRALDKPVIAAVNGPAAGAGLSLACVCDIRIAAASATFVPAFVNIGLVPDAGGTWFIRRLLGASRSFEWMSSGRRLSADEAAEWGLVSEVVEDERLPARVAELAAQLAALPTQAIGMTKRLFDHAEHATLEEQLEQEAAFQADAIRTEDFAEGIAAFREKRPPRFTGKPRPRHPIALLLSDDRTRWRLTVALRWILVIPHVIVVEAWALVVILLSPVLWLLTLWKGRLPRGLHGFAARYLRYWTHVTAYSWLIADPFPQFRGWRGTYPIDLAVAPPAPQSRGRTFFRLILVIPALLLAQALGVVIQIVGIIGWFAALATARMPKGLRDLGAYSIRFKAQTYGYLLFLTDRYPSLASNPLPEEVEAAETPPPA
jgi:2-(1,2-epoxy-1,2-dihydrophenyl)acetyl-CoA isomerase